jgi:hypothetical protein
MQGTGQIQGLGLYNRAAVQTLGPAEATTNVTGYTCRIDLEAAVSVRQDSEKILCIYVQCTIVMSPAWKGSCCAARTPAVSLGTCSGDEGDWVMAFALYKASA